MSGDPIDHADRVPLAPEDGVPIIHVTAAGWYYLDRRYEEDVGPYATEVEARAEAAKFAMFLARGTDPEGGL